MPALEDIKYDTLPAHMQESVRLYIEEGRPVGNFLHSLFCNELRQTFSHADGTNLAAIQDWVLFVYNEMPGDACGNEKAYDYWTDIGGFRGHSTLLKMKAMAKEKEIEFSEEEMIIAKLTIGNKLNRREEIMREWNWVGQPVVGFSTPVYVLRKPARTCFRKMLDLGIITREGSSYQF